MRKEELTEWLEERVTREFIKLLENRRDEYKSAIESLVMRTDKLVEIDNKISQFKGHVFALEHILNLEYFMGDIIDETEIYSVRAESDN